MTSIDDVLAAIRACEKQTGHMKHEAGYCPDVRAAIERALAGEVWKEHRPATSDEHGIEGRIHGYCRRCIREWPCAYSPERTMTQEPTQRHGT